MESKNAPIISDLNRQVEKIKEVREHLSGSYNNDMNKDVTKILRHAEHVVQDYVETLK